jgi:hypothetical protein
MLGERRRAGVGRIVDRRVRALSLSGKFVVAPTSTESVGACRSNHMAAATSSGSTRFMSSSPNYAKSKQVARQTVASVREARCLSVRSRTRVGESAAAAKKQSHGNANRYVR